MRVLVTGASGFVGSALISHLSADPSIRVAGLVRPQTARHLNNSYPRIIGDLGHVENFREELVSFDVIVHTAGRAHLMRDNALDPLREFRKVNTDGTLHIATAAANAGVKRFIFLSTSKVNGETTPPGRPFDEESPPAPFGDYAVSKYEAELGLNKLSQTSHMEVCIIRPTLVYGRGAKGNVGQLNRLIKRGVPLPFASITRNQRSMIHLENLISLINMCINCPRAANKTFLASDDRDMSTSEFINYLALLSGHRAHQFPIPVGFLEWAARVMGKETYIKRLTGNLQVDVSYTKEVLNWAPPKQVGA